MESRVLLTIDTELTFGHYSRGLPWQENFRRSYEAAGVGVPYQLERLAAHGLKACFFVDPMPALLYGLDPIRRMIDPILTAGQEVQLHLHSVWAAAAEGRSLDRSFELTDFQKDEQIDLVRKAHDLIVDAGAPAPIAFRAGSYAANDATLKALATLGISYDSSHNGSHAPSPSAIGLDRFQIAPVERCGVIEIPIATIEDLTGRLRHLQLCAVSSTELVQALKHAAQRRHPVVTLVSHSFELATRDGLTVNSHLKRRFETLCAFLARHHDQLPTLHFADLGSLPLRQPAEPLPASRLRTAVRMVEQAWSNVRYEGRL